ncbi:MAG: EamA family transporter [Burkholderiaceae bacterium]|nr:EamA family transporter [Roseateles sp.]MBV8470529.1 EamA family transporter [Burkholderiaceae bacterium]
MPFNHLLLALAVVAVWGSNFVVIKWGLAEFPPFTLAMLRFAASALPWVLLVKRPVTPLWRLAAFGVLLGCGQFGLLFLAMKGSISPGLASLVVQSQVFITVGVAAWLHQERVRPGQWLAALLVLAGMGWIGWQGHQHAGDATVRGVLTVLGAAACWACANLVARGAGRVDALAFMVWSSLFAVPPLIGLACWIDGPQAVVNSMAHASLGAWAVVAWQALGNTLFGYGAWNWLLARHPASVVAPSALLVPVFGFTSSALVLGEALPAWKLGAATLVMAGMGLNLWVARRN